ncbi:hypothetical protein Patl1_28694 [Pistacia atlantica]|uniref:Uncharacterized protein n=1 Tax=Pistacia atlantica TaxID=434234 RepID=A0ACC1BBW4_9ROSI|nr:hypothetical protein Patl1_28694 [Pistacia atlantica]
MKTSSHSQFQRRPKSKSGPIVPPSMGRSSLAMQLLDGVGVKNFMAASPFSTGVLVPNGVCVNYGVDQGYLVQSQGHVARCSSVPSWSDLVDKRATTISWSKKHGSRMIKKCVPDIEELYQNPSGPCASSWDLSKATTNISKLRREEAKISAWENLQKAKVEATIRKLEMKLEKKRSHSMDKILNKLKISQRKAQEMRSLVSITQEQQVAKTSHKVRFFHKHVQKSSFRTCFTYHGA